MNQVNGAPQVTGPFRKSQHSNTLNGILNCAEVAPTSDGGRAIRDSKQGPDGPVLYFTRTEIAAFFAGVRDGEFGEF